jgi:hypothetical protein
VVDKSYIPVVIFADNIERFDARIAPRSITVRNSHFLRGCGDMAVLMESQQWCGLVLTAMVWFGSQVVWCNGVVWYFPEVC